MGRERLLGSARYPRPMNFPRPFAGWMTCAPLATEAANAGRWFARAQRLLRPIATSGSARLATAATGITERNCAGGSLPLGAISRRLSSKLRARGSHIFGQYGTGAVLTDVAGFAFVTRGKENTACSITRWFRSVCTFLLIRSNSGLQSQMVRSLYDCPQIPVGPDGTRCRVIVATHPSGKKKSPVGVTRAGVVYELFFTTLPQRAFTACDVVELYLHRGAFEPALADEDSEQDPDRWCSHAACGQAAWQIISQWVWNIRLELGHQLGPMPVLTTQVAPALPSGSSHATARPASSAPASGYGPPTW